MAPPGPEAETSCVLQVFMLSVKLTLIPELFDKFVMALTDYRRQRILIHELVDVVSECFDHREVREMRLVEEFNTFLPPGHAVHALRNAVRLEE